MQSCVGALTERRNKSSLTHVHLAGNNLSNEGLVEIATALREYSNLVSLDIYEGLSERDSNFYDTLAPIIDLECITSSSRNAEILRKLRDDDVPGCGKERGVLYVVDYEYDGENHFIATEQDDWGWLGYFIGKSEELQQLDLFCLPEEEDEVDAFMEGFKLNRSIEDLSIRVLIDIQGDDIIDSLSTFMLNTRILRRLELCFFDIGLECARSLALALDQRQDKSLLTTFNLEQNNLGSEGLAHIAVALSAYPHLRTLCFSKHSFGREGCGSLGSLLGSTARSCLEQLILTENTMDDAGLQTLVSGLVTSCVGLKRLYLSRNPTITAAGLRCLAGLFQAQAGSCCLESLFLKKNEDR